MAAEVQFGYNPQDYNMESGKALGEARRAQGEANRGLSGQTDWLAFAKGMVGVAEQYNKYSDAQKQMTRATEAASAKDIATRLVLSERYRLANASMRTQMWQELQAQGEEERSDDFNAAFRGYMKTPYITEYDKQNQDINNSVLNTTHADFTAASEQPSNVPEKDSKGKPVVDDKGKPVMKTNIDAYGSKWATKYVEQLKKAHPQITSKQINMALSKGLLDKHLMEIASVTDRDALNTVLLEQAEERIPFQNEQFFRTTGAQGKEAVAEGKRRLKAATDAKEKQFKAEAEAKVALAAGTWNNIKTMGTPVADVLPDILYLTRGKPKEKKIQIDTAVKNYAAHIKAVEFNNNAPVDRPRPKKYAITKDWVTDKQLQAEIARVGAEHYDTGNYDGVIRTINYNESKNLKGLGQYISNSFLQAETGEELNTAMGQLMNVASRPRGSAALRKAISDDTFEDMIGIHGIMVSMYPNDPKAARNFYDEQKRNKTTNILSRELKTKMVQRGKKLGDNFSMYNTVMTNLNNISPRLAKQQESTVAEYFSSAHIEYTGADDSTIIVNTANGPDTIHQNATDPDFAYGLVNKLATQFFKDDEYSIATMPDGMLQVKDIYGGSSFIINPTVLVDITNKKTFAEQQAALNGLPIGEMISSGSSQIARGLRDSFDTMFAKLGTHMYENDKEFIDFVREIPEALGDAWSWFDSWDNTSEVVNRRNEERAQEERGGVYSDYNVTGGN